MPNPIRLILALHDHQPIGNFDHVFQRAYEDSYLPLLDVFSRYESLRMALHTSGSLMEWLEASHPEYVDRLARLASEGRLEIIGGAFYEPILGMIPSRDRIGQIRSYSRWLQNRLGTSVRGMWMPERVWEQSFTRDVVDAGIEYTILDDFHFKTAGLTDAQLQGHLITEDEGRVLVVFPGSERLRYTIPFAAPEETIKYLAGLAEQRPGSIALFGDDGEKFGTWPETKKHVYEDGWLVRFFDALVANQDWIQVTTPSEAIDNVPPVGKVYLPDCSYREMTEWALPTEQLVEYERLSHELRDDPRWSVLRRFVGGGFWRNFKAKYPEADEMYGRMMMVSRRVQEALDQGPPGALVEQARTHLYRAQCNCGHWHGAFGGIYLPHLRNAVYRSLIAADNLLERAAGRPEAWVEATADDFNFDGRQEVRLANDRLLAMILPSRGGQLAELDVRRIQHNLLATLARQPEAYHRKVLAGNQGGNGSCASIHERVIFKQADLDQRIQYDKYPRKSLLDLFYDQDATLAAVAAGEAAIRSDFTAAIYEARIRRNPDRIQVQLVREGPADGHTVRITKGLTLDAGSATLQIAYMLENLPPERPLHFAVEFNFAGLPAGADDRYFHDLDGNRLGQTGARLDLYDALGLGLCDEWLGLDVGLTASRPTHFWTFPIETVSQSEGGFELVHQSTVVQPHWLVTPDRDGRWTVLMQLALDTSRAESRAEQAAAAVTG
ncbi:MAG: alpha-amylase/4-alpha-glucanotransferase domain-containing protein [Thermoguttaceae bacterium]|jgi:alpha-amylase